MAVLKSVAVLVVFGLAVAGCSGSDGGAEGSVAAPETSEVVEESTTTTVAEFEAIPEIADAVRPELVIPDSDSYDNPVEEVLARYTLYQQARYFAAGPPIADPNYEPIGDLMSGDVEQAFRDLMSKWQDGNVVQVVEENDTVTYSPVVLSPVFEEVEGATVIVQDCVVDGSYLRDRATGDVVDEGLRTRQLTVRLIFSGGQWRVHESNVNHKYEGESACPERS